MSASPLHSLGFGAAADTACRPSRSHAPPGAFSRLIDQYLGQPGRLQATADQAVLDLATGKTEEVHQVMLAVARAELAFRTVLEIRNRLTEAYQEVTRLQV